jgi:hypothetical protein
MEKFLELNPEFEKQAKLIYQIKNRMVFKEIPSLDSYLSVFKTSVCKKLVEKNFHLSDKLKETYSKIIKKESNEVEKMIFQMLSKKKIHFKEIELKFLFYKEFPGFIDLFESKASIEDLLFRKVYLRCNEDEKIQQFISKSNFKSQIFYILSLHSFLNQNYIKNKLFEIKNDQEIIRKHENISESDFISCWALALPSLTEHEYYTLVASELLYSTYSYKLIFFRSIKDAIDLKKLSIFLIKACFSNPLSLVKTYIVFLKVIELFNLNYDLKLKLLYSWLRYFIKEDHIDLFLDLMKNLKKSKKLNEEFEIYRLFEENIVGNTTNERVLSEIEMFSDQNDISEISLKMLSEKLKNVK